MNNNAALVIFGDYTPMTGLIHIESQFETPSSWVFGYHGDKPLSNVPDRLRIFLQWKPGHDLGLLGK